MTLLCVYQVSQHSWLIYLLCFRSLLRQSGPLRVSFTSLPSDCGGKLLVLPYEPPSSACWAPSLPLLPFSSWPHAALNTGISVLRYRKKWATVHTLQREKHLFSMAQVFFFKWMNMIRTLSLLICLSQVQELFQAAHGEVFNIRPPSSMERRNFFEDLIINQASKAPASKKKAGKKKKKWW